MQHWLYLRHLDLVGIAKALGSQSYCLRYDEDQLCPDPDVHTQSIEHTIPLERHLIQAFSCGAVAFCSIFILFL